MSTVLDRTGSSAPPRGGEPLPYPVVAGALGALQAVGAGLVGLLVPVVATWVVSAGGSATWQQAIRISLTLWLLAHHTAVTVTGGRVSVAPLGLTLLPLAACWYAGRRMARSLDPAAERIAAGASRARPAVPPRTASVAFVATYTLLATLAAAAAAMESTRPVVVQAVLSGIAVSVLGGGAGIAAYRFGGLRAGLLGAVRALPLPDRLRRWLRPAAWALAVQLVSSAVVLIVVLVAGRGQILALHRALDPGLVGGLVLGLGQLALLPNLVVWVGAVLAGPGFAVGSGTSVTVGSSVLGPLPAVPVLGALPPPGPLPAAATALLLVPFAAGCLVAVLVLRSDAGRLAVEPEDADADGLGAGRRALAAALDVAGAAGVAGLGFALLAWLSGGAAGPGRLSVTGPPARLAGLVLAGELLAGGLLTVLVAWGVPALLRATRGAPLPDPWQPPEP